MKKNAFSLLIIVTCIFCVFALNRSAVSSRIYAKVFDLSRDRFPLHVVSTSGELYALWQGQKVHGRVVVHLGKYLHFTDSQIASGVDGQFFPQIATVASDYLHYKIRPPSCRNFLWNAFQENIVRKIYNVIPQPEFSQRFGLQDAAPNPQPITEKFAASGIYDGAQRVFTPILPQITEPVLLNIDASFFASSSAELLIKSLTRSGLKSDLVTVCLSVDNPDVTEMERQRARDFIQLLSNRPEIASAANSSPPETATK